MKRSPLKRKTPLRKVSKKRAIQNKEYSKARSEYLADQPACEVCGKRATQIHHKRGRFQERLNDKTFFMAICFACHNYIHANPAWAYARDYLIKR